MQKGSISAGWAFEGVAVKTQKYKAGPMWNFVFKSAAARDQAIDQFSINFEACSKIKFISTNRHSSVLRHLLKLDHLRVKRSTFNFRVWYKRTWRSRYSSPLSRSTWSLDRWPSVPSVVRGNGHESTWSAAATTRTAAAELSPFVCLTIGSQGDIQPYIPFECEISSRLEETWSWYRYYCHTVSYLNRASLSHSSLSKLQLSLFLADRNYSSYMSLEHCSTEDLYNLK